MSSDLCLIVFRIQKDFGYGSLSLSYNVMYSYTLMILIRTLLFNIVCINIENTVNLDIEESATTHVSAPLYVQVPKRHTSIYLQDNW